MARTPNTTETPVQVADRVVATAQEAYDKTVVRLRANYEKLQAAIARRAALGPFPELDDAAVQGVADPKAAANARLAAEVAVATDETGTLVPLGAQFAVGDKVTVAGIEFTKIGEDPFSAPPANPFAQLASAGAAMAASFPTPETITEAAETASRAAFARTAEQEKEAALNGLPDEARKRVQAAMAAAKEADTPAPPAAPVNPFAGLIP